MNSATKRLQHLAIISTATMILGCDQAPDGEPMVESEDMDKPQVLSPRWVLRDKDGARMPALVEPRCGHWHDSQTQLHCDPPEFGSPGRFPCALVSFWEGQYINLQYELKSGTFGPCMSGQAPAEGNSSLRELAGFGFHYTDDACEGSLFKEMLGGGGGNYGSDVSRHSRDVFRAVGKDWYISSEDCIDPGPCRIWLPSTSECQQDTCERLCPLKPVPQWLYELMPNPPYTMAVEYE
ncbi:MAG TPA: hypothetical protein VGB85_23120 [Nannocystis sp.]|jgi:hypothetical protein